MKVIVTSVPVSDQDKALKFYTEVLRFVKKTDVPAGDAKWLTVVSPEYSDGVEILLEPNWNPTIQINGNLHLLNIKKYYTMPIYLLQCLVLMMFKKNMID